MEIIKQLKDYSKTKDQQQLLEFFSQKLVLGGVCKEKIKNKDFMVAYIKPVNDFIISTTALPCSTVGRLTC